MKKETRKYLDNNENGNTTFQNLWGAAKVVLIRKFIVTQEYLKKQEKSQVNNVTIHLEDLEKEEQSPKSVD